MSKSRILSLFDQYAANLAIYWPQDSERFLCPLCHRFFLREAIDRDELSIEHVVPESLGGRVTTLTCTACNNQAGTKLDAALVARLRFEDWATGQSSTPMTTRVEVGEDAGWFNAEVSVTPEGLEIRGLPSNSDPTEHRRALQSMALGTSHLTISRRLAYNGYDVHAALLRSAYLLLFSYFGYGYVLHENLRSVFNCIREPQTSMWQTGMFLVPELPRNNVVALVNSPSDLRCFIAMLRLATDVERKLIIMMPGTGSPADLHVCTRWATMGENEAISLNLRADGIEQDPQFLVDPEHKYLTTRLSLGMVEFVDPPNAT